MQSEKPLSRLDPIEEFRTAYWEPIRHPLRRFTLVGVLISILAAALVAREGTFSARLAALCVVFATGIWLAAWHWRRLGQRRDAHRVLSQVVMPSDREGGLRAMRAIRLHERSLRDTTSGSSALAMRYVERSLSLVSTRSIHSKARRTAIVLETLAMLGLLASGFIVVVSGHRILEGCDVALAFRGRAPFQMFWLDVNGVSALPPAYLRSSEHSLLFGTRVSEPKGTLVWIRGVPIHPGVDLTLTNGTRFVPFEGNSDGEVIARWVVERPERLHVAARMGQVLIEQGDELIVDAEIDEPPSVELENASHSIRLRQVDRVEVFYRARDDHGLRQIDLVLKSADREERRQLMRLDGQRREQQGAYALSVDEPFLKNARLPILLRVEARDDNSRVENNWGHSEWLTLEPPSPGESEASRLQTLDSIRASLLDWLALEVVGDRGQANLTRQDEIARHTMERIRQTEREAAGSEQLPKPVILLLRAQREQLEKMSPHATGRLETLEEATLTVDAAHHVLAQRDAKSVSHSLAELADEVARGAAQASNSEKKKAAIRRVDEAAYVLENGGRQLANLGSLGTDLAGIIRATLNRMRRARDAEDFTHVQLAAEYLAARLRRPVPSAAQSSGVESGAPNREASKDSKVTASDADVRIERLLIELQQLRQEHQSAVEWLERTLKSAEALAEIDEPRLAAKQRADGLRRAAEHLPSLGAEPDSALSSQVVAREQALGMADSIERLAYNDALTRGRAALDAINEAVIRAPRDADDRLDKKVLQSLREELRVQLQALEQALERAKQKASRAASDQLRDQVGNERQLASRAHVLANRKKVGDATLPESMRSDLDKASGLMKQASDALDHNDGELALDHEQRAQALLDQFDSQPDQTSPGNTGGENNHTLPSTDKGTVKPTGDPQAAAAFRRRVQRGLSQEVPGELGAAIRRYAEGLLR